MRRLEEARTPEYKAQAKPLTRDYSEPDVLAPIPALKLVCDRKAVLGPVPTSLSALWVLWFFFLANWSFVAMVTEVPVVKKASIH
jgi:hypothetical protein